MVKNSIKIYARLKRDRSNESKTACYRLCKCEENDYIVFRIKNSNDDVKTKTQNYKFRFHEIFDQDASQVKLFDSIAKPVILSVLSGYNGTIFAYGQTGSGKTYAITGSSTNYNERGIIPRSIEEIFNLIEQNTENYSIAISYLEIYNEIGYDLLNPKQQVSSLEELPKIMLLEDGKGESHLRNLTIRRVTTKHEAMKLLYQGDTNRTMAETPMNVYSSRSHCIFTISVTCQISGKIIKSKLNLVDLAGSERIKKANISGTTLNEAKHINLSLHYLEQVVTALSQNKPHVPFRNSMLTYLLRDSLSRNCLTVLIATLAVKSKNLEENLATCKFAQRVADVSVEAISNSDTNPQEEIDFLKAEIDELKKQITEQAECKEKPITKEEKDNWGLLLNDYISNDDDKLFLNNDNCRHIQYCFTRLKETVRDHEQQKHKLEQTATHHNQEIENYKTIVMEKEKEIQSLKGLVKTGSSNPKSFSEGHETNIKQPKNIYVFTQDEKRAFKTYVENPKISADLDFYKQSVEDMYKIASNLNLVVEQCKKNIVEIKSKLETNESQSLRDKLINQQTIYKKSLNKLENLKVETNHFKVKWEKARSDVIRKFFKWCTKISCGDHSNDSNSNLNLKGEGTLSLRHSMDDGGRKIHFDSTTCDRYSKPLFKEFDVCSYGCGLSNVLQLEPERPYSNQCKNRHVTTENSSISSVLNDYSFKPRTVLDTISKRIELVGDNRKKNSDPFVINGLDGGQKIKSGPDNIQNLTKLIYPAPLLQLSTPSSSSSPFDGYHAFKDISKTSENVFRREENSNDKEMTNTQEALQESLKESLPKMDDSFGSSEQILKSVETKLINSQTKFKNVNFCYFTNVSLLEPPKTDPNFEIKKCGDESDSDSFRSAVDPEPANYQNELISKEDTNAIEQSSSKKDIELLYLFLANDSETFKTFIKTLPLTGDHEVDEEIVKFYRAKFNFISNP